MLQNGRKSQEDFEEIFGFAKTIAAAIASYSFSLRKKHFRWQPHYFWKIFRTVKIYIPRFPSERKIGCLKFLKINSGLLLRSIKSKTPRYSFFKKRGVLRAVFAEGKKYLWRRCLFFCFVFFGQAKKMKGKTNQAKGG